MVRRRKKRLLFFFGEIKDGLAKEKKKSLYVFFCGIWP
jgi:hypothetical protein